MKNTTTSDETLNARLLEAYQTDPDKSKMGRLRKQYDTIIGMQEGGMSLEKILGALNEDPPHGLCLTMKTFNGYMYLLRKERSAAKVAVTTLPPATQEAPKPVKARKNKGKNKSPATPDLMDKEGKENAVTAELTFDELKAVMSGNTDYSKF